MTLYNLKHIYFLLCFIPVDPIKCYTLGLEGLKTIMPRFFLSEPSKIELLRHILASEAQIYLWKDAAWIETQQWKQKHTSEVSHTCPRFFRVSIFLPWGVCVWVFLYLNIQVLVFLFCFFKSPNRISWSQSVYEKLQPSNECFHPDISMRCYFYIIIYDIILYFYLLALASGKV